MGMARIRKSPNPTIEDAWDVVVDGVSVLVDLEAGEGK